MYWAVSLLIAFSIAKVQSSDNAEWNTIINKVNSANGTWKAGLNFPDTISSSYIKKIMGTNLEKDMNIEKYLRYSFLEHISDDDIPDEFDAREEWPHCKEVISHIRDQGPCGSCWAVAAVSTFTDRLCIASKPVNKTKVIISADHLLACTFIGGCWGGFLRMAWWHIKHFGVVTGGDYNSNVGCKPYSLQPCEHNTEGPRQKCQYILAKTPKCESHCTNQQYPLSLKEDYYQAKDYFTISGERNIQKAILSGGPVEAGFLVYSDFVTYKSGVYNYKYGDILGGHAVKILGWGVENGTPYWLCANSWNTNWGDSGFFKFQRGINHARIEESVFFGVI